MSIGTAIFLSSPEQIKIDLPAVRQIADDFQRYWDFGLALANCIAVEINGAARSVGSLVYHEWPEQPPFPFSLDAARPSDSHPTASDSVS
jgi:hypothetical protein